MLPTILIVIVAVIAIAALLVMRSRQNKNSVGGKKSKTTNNKSAKATESANLAEKKSAAPKIDLDNLLTQLDLLITDKEFAKAEASINLHLKQDSSLHALYLKLANIYHAQEDDFAIKQLLDTLQKLNLNEVYQRVFNEHEAFKAEQEKKQALEQSQKTPDVFEFTSSTVTPVDNSSGFDSLAATDTVSTQQDNSLDFADLASAPSITHTTTDEPALSFDSLNLATPEPATAIESPTLDFNLSTPTTEATSPVQEPSLYFDLATPTAESTPAQEPNLDFKLDIPSTQETPAAPSLDFNLDAPVAPTAEPSLDFSLDAPTTPAVSPSLDFSLDTPVAAPSLDFSLDTPVAEPTTPEQVDSHPAPQTSATDLYADANDPIVQSFAELANTNPIDLDIELAEQYIRLGATQAAKSLLQNQANLSTEQAAKVDTLLQKIA